MKGFKPVFTEDEVITSAPALTLSDAVKLLQAAGHRGKFFNVALRKPLAAQRFNPLYIFTFATGNYVAVDTVTRRVFPY